MATTQIPRASGATLDSDWSLLLAACSVASEEKTDRIRRLLQKVSWQSVLALAERHGALSLLYQALSSGAHEVPQDALRLLRERHQTNLHKCLFLARELIRILERLDQLQIEVMPYKGVALAEQMYGDIALRQSGDIDVLIRPGDLQRIKEALRDLGYTPHDLLSSAEERAYLRSGYECAFDSPAGRNLLELQWAIQPRFYAVDMDMEGLFQRAVRVTVTGRPMKTPSPEDQLLILSVHAAKHVWGRLIWLCDIAQIMRLPSLNWNWIEEQAETLGTSRIVRVTLILTKRLLGSTIPATFEETIATDRHAMALADEIGIQIAAGTSYHVESLAYFRLMLRLRERMADRVRFLQRLIFTPGPNEWKTVRLPAPLFPLYRLVRLSRLAGRLIRA